MESGVYTVYGTQTVCLYCITEHTRVYVCCSNVIKTSPSSRIGPHLFQSVFIHYSHARMLVKKWKVKLIKFFNTKAPTDKEKCKLMWDVNASRWHCHGVVIRYQSGVNAIHTEWPKPLSKSKGHITPPLPASLNNPSKRCEYCSHSTRKSLLKIVVLKWPTPDFELITLLTHIWACEHCLKTDLKKCEPVL